MQCYYVAKVGKKFSFVFYMVRDVYCSIEYASLFIGNNQK